MAPSLIGLSRKSPMEKKTALITGITGQDGSYLTELLLAKGYAVHGVVRRTSNLLRSRIEHLRNGDNANGKSLFLHYGDLSDGTTLRRIFSEVRPAEIYHLAGQSHVGLSFEIPESTCEEIGMATLRLLEIARDQPQPAKFSATPPNRPRPKRRPSGLRAPTVVRRHSPPSSRAFTGNPMGSLFATGFCTTTSRRGVARIS
jgi:hypothetical protein